MFRRPTVLVVGAGASSDLEFPLGDALRYKISELFKQVRVEQSRLIAPDDVMDAIRAHSAALGFDLRDYHSAARVLASHIMYARSIDEFVDHHRENPILVFLAKVGICKTILHCEKNSKLFSTSSSTHVSQVNHALLDKNDAWLKQLWYMMREGVAKEHPDHIFKNLSIINFNYDRTLEAFLAKALQDMFDLTVGQANDFVSAARIYHPYGVVDQLQESPQAGTPFGGGYQPNLYRLATNIRTYCESEVSPAKAEFQVHLSEARSVVFLGFAYRQLNLELLKNQGISSVSIFGTSLGNPDENHSGIDGRLSGVFQRTNGAVHCRLRGVKGAELLRVYEEPLIG